MLKFDTLRKKPKVYNIAVLTGALAVFLAMLLRMDETYRLQWGNLALTLYFALVIACVVGLLLQFALKRGREDAAFPFGPSIALAAGLMLLYGGPLVDWYRGLLIN